MAAMHERRVTKWARKPANTFCRRLDSHSISVIFWTITKNFRRVDLTLEWLH